MTTESLLEKSSNDDSIYIRSPYWWAFVFRGIVAFIIAVLAFLMPAESLLALTIVFGAFCFGDGIFRLISAGGNIRKGYGWRWLAFSGILGILTAVIILVSPLVATFVIATFLWGSIAFWSLSSGVLEIMAAMRLRDEFAGEIWLILSGTLSVVLAGIVFWLLLMRPLETFLALGWLLGSYASLSGFILVVLGLRLRKARNEKRANTPATEAMPDAYNILPQCPPIEDHQMGCRVEIEDGNALSSTLKNDAVDPVVEAGRESFPASDPPSWTGVTVASSGYAENRRNPPTRRT